MSKDAFLKAARGANDTGRSVFGTGTSIVCRDLMERLGVSFPDAHLDPEKMTSLAIAGHTELGLDVVMPLFSVCHEVAAVGCNVSWGDNNQMPEAGKAIFAGIDDITIPSNFLTHPGCAVPLAAISLLAKRLGDSAAVCGKVMGPWTQSYHYFGVENFLIGTIDSPDETRRILDKLLPVTLLFARAQLEAGADCILLADHATRDLCSPQTYEQFVKPLHCQIAQQIDAPLLLHICGNTSDRIGMIGETGLDCFHWDTKTGSPAEVRKLAGDKLALMGGISNIKLLTETPDVIAADTREAIEAGIDIVGPECAVPLATPLENLKAIASVG